MGTTYEHAALLVMDVQPNIIERLGDAKTTYLDSVRAAVAAAHAHNIPVIFVVVGFRPGLPEISSRNKSFSTLKGDTTRDMTQYAPVLQPEGSDIVVTKRRISAFTGSDLEVVLRGQDVTHLILCGISTSGVVLSTTREAADKDYKLTILSDLCNDADSEVHTVLTEKIFPKQATVMLSQDWIESL